MKEIEAAVADILKPLGFRKRGTTWHLDRGEVISVLNLQGSRWGDDSYINCGVLIKENAARINPVERECHIRWRPTSTNGGAVPANKNDLEFLITQLALPWLNRLNSRDAIARFLDSGEVSDFLVRRGIREWAGLDASGDSA